MRCCPPHALTRTLTRAQHSLVRVACSSLARSLSGASSPLCTATVAGPCDAATAAATCDGQSNTDALTTRCVVDTAGAASCECEVGYRMDGGKCTDVNECELEGVCPYDGTRNVCSNTFGSYR